jgi:hypothetical protein
MGGACSRGAAKSVAPRTNTEATSSGPDGCEKNGETQAPLATGAPGADQVVPLDVQRAGSTGGGRRGRARKGKGAGRARDKGHKPRLSPHQPLGYIESKAVQGYPPLVSTRRSRHPPPSAFCPAFFALSSFFCFLLILTSFADRH